MKIRAVQLRVQTAKGLFGFKIGFSDRLTIIRGGNSSGKSTVIHTVMYGLGLEELIGGKGPAVLPYAVKDTLDHDGERLPVLASEVVLEIANKSSAIASFRRAIYDKDRSHKLVEIFDGALLTKDQAVPLSQSTYLFDPGAAQGRAGFHSYLSAFLELDLPLVPTTTGGDAPLYVQAVFAALMVEQKRGWSDYLANVPFLGLRDARLRVVEYLLGLQVFDLIAKRNQLDAEAVAIAGRWEAICKRFSAAASEAGLIARGLVDRPTALFERATVTLLKRTAEGEQPIGEFMEGIRVRYQELQRRIDDPDIKTDDVKARYGTTADDLQRLSSIFEESVGRRSMLRAALDDYEQLLDGTNEDLSRNKSAEKLLGLGATLGIASAVNRCPTCDQSVPDSLLDQLVGGPTMELSENIRYLEQQRAMLERQVSGTKKEIAAVEIGVRELELLMTSAKGQLEALRTDFSTGHENSRADIRRQYELESEYGTLRKIQTSYEECVMTLSELASRLQVNQAARKLLPRSGYTAEDEGRVALFEKFFRANAGSFEYGSAPVADISIGRETLTPVLAQMELREVKSDVRADSSASDFVRLIWSYLLGVYQTSSFKGVDGNHPGILVFDEPGQHSMAADSQRALVLALSAEQDLQSIVAASFDEVESVFRHITDGVPFKLVEWEGKSIGPIDHRTFV